MECYLVVKVNEVQFHVSTKTKVISKTKNVFRVIPLHKAQKQSKTIMLSKVQYIVGIDKTKAMKNSSGYWLGWGRRETGQKT